MATSKFEIIKPFTAFASYLQTPQFYPSLTRVEPNKVLRAKKSLSFVNLAYDTASIASFGFLVYSTFLPLKTALHHKRVFFSGFLVRLRVDILNIFQA